jgi:HEAT repeat protein
LAQIGAEAGSDTRGQASLALVHAVQRDKDGSIRARAARALRMLVGKEVPSAEACSALLTALSDPDVNVRAEAAAVLSKTMAQGVRLFRRWWRKVEVRSVEELATI